jgi:hypothetical protein
MMGGMRRVLVLVALAAATLSAQFPSAEISNGKIKAKLWLPDAKSGYYQGTRFDWSGSIASLEANGHSYFGQWFDKHDPKIHDAITGPVEEFLSNDVGLGYDEAKPGELFVRIGVGAVRKPDEPKYRRFATYDIVDGGKWSTKSGKDWIEFTHVLGDTNGYSYVYRKKLKLTGDKLVMEHHLKNTGRKAIPTAVYDHDFFMLDAQPTSSDIVVRLPWAPHAKVDSKDLATTRDKEFVFLKELQRGQTVQTDLEGFSSKVSDYDIRVENKKTGAAVRQTSDHPMSRLLLWSIRSNVSTEAYIDLNVAPGKESSWKIQYEFYTVK